MKLWTSPKDPQPRISKYPKSSLIWFPWDSPRVLNKWVKECLNNVLDPVKSCHELHQLCRDFMLVHSTILNILQNCATILSSRATIFAVTNLQVVDSKSCQDLPNCATILLATSIIDHVTKRSLTSRSFVSKWIQVEEDELLSTFRR